MMTSAVLESNAYNDDKWLNYISKQNLPYLEFGMKRHPQKQLVLTLLGSITCTAGCIESCGNGDELIRKFEETEAKASTLRNELASVEASLASIRDKIVHTQTEVVLINSTVADLPQTQAKEKENHNTAPHP
ncbi:hypothetical protein K1719_016670 [Acacia pycnantha]|nr:hypothetical protein K1719_016670 [Acacia pycnantha]